MNDMGEVDGNWLFPPPCNTRTKGAKEIKRIVA